VIARTLPARTAEEIVRLVRALGSHRYVAGRLLLVHAFVFDALAEAGIEELREACAWAEGVLSDERIDPDSRDERLWRRASEREVAAALGAFWECDERAERAREELEDSLAAIGADLGDPDGEQGELFDESEEEDIFPVLVDAGWELLPLASLDAERHKGAIEAFGDRFAFDCAKFEEESAVGGPPPLQELPAIGARELLYGAAHGILRAPLVLWTEGSETYHDYVIRGVLRAAKVD
jgi:hypothetical protein